MSGWWRCRGISADTEGKPGRVSCCGCAHGSRDIVCGLFDDPRPRQGLVSIPRGNGKGTLAAALGQACRRFTVREIVCDPFRWQRSMQALEAENLPVVEFPQSPSRMTPATTRMFEAVVNGTLTHSGDGRLARHVGNCVLRINSRGSRLAKEHKHSQRRIDLGWPRSWPMPVRRTWRRSRRPMTSSKASGDVAEAARAVRATAGTRGQGHVSQAARDAAVEAGREYEKHNPRPAFGDGVYSVGLLYTEEVSP